MYNEEIDKAWKRASRQKIESQLLKSAAVAAAVTIYLATTTGHVIHDLNLNH